jgi:ubiquinone/menaquinone biosynthesis C-methylase UbiE
MPNSNAAPHRLTAALLLVAFASQPLLTAQSHNQPSGGRSSKEVELAVDALGLKEGATVAEVGAGDARFSFRFAEVVGQQGRVYTNELGASTVRRIQQQAEQRQLSNLIAVEGAVDDTKLPDACCDAMMMRLVYHMLTQPEPMARSFFRALRPGGVLLILEGNPHPGRRNAAGVPDNRAGMGIDPKIVIEELTAVGFEFDRRVPDWVGADYALLFRKPPA